MANKTNRPGTPGQWSFRKQSSFNGYYIESSTGAFIGETGGGIMHDDELLENTRLIAAAPDMLEVLQNIVEYWDTPNKAGKSLHEHIQYTLELAELAIKKATK